MFSHNKKRKRKILFRSCTIEINHFEYVHVKYVMCECFVIGKYINTHLHNHDDNNNNNIGQKID